jgi:formylglycine-generating enzyme required for sulfatase activity
MLAALLDRESYAQLNRDDVAVMCDLMAEKGVIPSGPKGFAIDRVESFTCGAPVAITHAIAIYRHLITGLEFALVPAGRFAIELGPPDPREDDGNPDRTRTVGITRPFLIARTPVTQACWLRVGKRKNPSRFVGEHRPVDHVTFAAAAKWCATLGLALPRDAQWEYAARAGSTTRFCYGDQLDRRAARFGHANRPLGATPPPPGTSVVASHAPNAFGLFDVHGQIGEWCIDRYGPQHDGLTLPRRLEFGARRVDFRAHRHDFPL